MNIFRESGLLSGYIALCALIFTVFELRLRVYNTIVEKVGRLYSKIFSTCQQLKGQVLSVKKLSENIAEFSQEEIIGYAKSCLRNKDIASSIHEIIDLTLPCFDLKEEAQKIQSVKAIFNFTLLALSLEESITAFYQGVLAGSNYQAKEVENMYKRMNKYFEMVEADDAHKIVSDRLSKLRKTKHPHSSRWILMCVVLFALIEVLSRMGARLS